MSVNRKIESFFDVYSSNASYSATRFSDDQATENVIGRASRPFSSFIESDMDSASYLWVKLSEHADFLKKSVESNSKIVEKVLEYTLCIDPKFTVEQIQYAFKLYLTHHETADGFKVPSLMRRTFSDNYTSEHNPPELPKVGGKTTSIEENRINWFREDPLANEHHEHWHLVYPRAGVLGQKLKDRHGELFFYMHQQMLARYDAERLAAGLRRVVPFSDMRQVIDVGYDPGSLQVGSTKFVARKENRKWEGIQEAALGQATQVYHVEDHEAFGDRLREAARSKKISDKSGAYLDMTSYDGTDLLGQAIESTSSKDSIVTGRAWGSHYGNFHGFGHVMTAYLDTKNVPRPKFWGVMFHEFAAIRDPFFWSWHKHIDSFNVTYQGTQPVHKFDDAPPIKFPGGSMLKSNGIALFRTDDIPHEVPFEEALELALGGNDVWDSDVESAQFPYHKGGTDYTLQTVSTLQTELRSGTFIFSNHKSYAYDYLWHEGFGYAFRLENDTEKDINVTVRVFLCPLENSLDEIESDPRANDRSLWIEMDKFAVSISKKTRKVITRLDRDSSIIKRPAEDPTVVTDIVVEDPENFDPEQGYCDCGWPYHLLLPRGTKKGMEFALLVIVTDGKIDQVPEPEHCGSMSYCGLKDKYPDTRPMGYPFDRRLGKNIQELVIDNNSYAIRSVSIKTN